MVVVAHAIGTCNSAHAGWMYRSLMLSSKYAGLIRFTISSLLP